MVATNATIESGIARTSMPSLPLTLGNLWPKRRTNAPELPVKIRLRRTEMIRSFRYSLVCRGMKVPLVG